MGEENQLWKVLLVSFNMLIDVIQSLIDVIQSVRVYQLAVEKVGPHFKVKVIETTTEILYNFSRW